MATASRSPAKLLILAPHPDDEAISCGGLIAYCGRRGLGWEIDVAVMAAGECRQLGTGKTEPTRRARELEEAALFGGYTASFAFVGEQFMRLDALPRKTLCDLIEDRIESFRPDLVVIPPASSYDQDHRAVAEAAVTALRHRPTSMRHCVPTVLEPDEPYWWRIDGQRPTPNFFVPLSEEQLEAKLRLVACHQSQDRPDPFGRSCDNLRRYAATYGVEIGGGFAEAYRLLRTRADVLF